MRWVLGVSATVVAIVMVAVFAFVVVTRSAGTALVDLELGECFDLEIDSPADSDERSTIEIVERVDVVDCSAAHEAEVVLVGELNADGDRGYPTDATLFDEIDRRCAVVVDAIGDRFGILPFAPSEASWDRHEGRFHCVAVPFGGGATTGSLVGG